MTALLRIAVATTLAVCIVGCASPGPPTAPTATVKPLQTKEIPAARARDAIAIGKSTKADVIAALGETLVISFDTGFEVWVYRLASDTPAQAQGIARIGSRRTEAAEFVVLFAPSGLVAKTRIRPAPPQTEPRG